MYILLAEDNKINQEVASAMLEDYGCLVDVADDGVIAIKKVKEKNYDIIFMDCQMPEMDGYLATTELKKLMKQKLVKKTPIIALTAHAMVGDRQKCLDAGMDDYMSKPIDEKILKEMLKKWSEADLIVTATGEIIEFRDNTVSGGDSINKLKNLMGEKFNNLIAAYIESSQKIVAGLIKAVKDKDLDSIAKLSHTLKSPSAQVGAKELSQKLGELEELAKKGSSPNIAATVSSICIMSEKINQELRNMLISV